MRPDRSPVEGPGPLRSDGFAFGLQIAADYEVPGLEPGAGSSAGRKLTLALADEAELRGAWRPRGARELSHREHPDGGTLLRIEADADAGYLFEAAGYGLHWLSADGRRARSAPPADTEPWLWQRYLIGQLLPFAAVLQGLEVLHAGAAIFDGQALAVSGPSGAGKSTLTALLTQRGGRFLTDDVLVLEAGRQLIAHPGAAVASIRHGAMDLPTPADDVRVGDDGEALRVRVERHAGPAPLGLLCFLKRQPEAEALSLERPAPLDPRLLLGATFNLTLRDPARLERQLELCAQISRQARVLLATVPESVGPEELAAELELALRQGRGGPGT
jgi:hypothetical protein